MKRRICSWPPFVEYGLLTKSNALFVSSGTWTAFLFPDTTVTANLINFASVDRWLASLRGE